MLNAVLTGPGDVDQQVAKRINYLKQGSPHNSERQRSNGQVIGIQGNPLPGWRVCDDVH